jgi:hypothetical protein
VRYFFVRSEQTGRAVAKAQSDLIVMRPNFRDAEAKRAAAMKLASEAQKKAGVYGERAESAKKTLAAISSKVL